MSVKHLTVRVREGDEQFKKSFIYHIPRQRMGPILYPCYCLMVGVFFYLPFATNVNWSPRAPTDMRRDKGATLTGLINSHDS